MRLPLGFQGFWFRLGQSQIDLLICISIICKLMWPLLNFHNLAISHNSFIWTDKQMICVSTPRISGSLIQVRSTPKWFAHLHISIICKLRWPLLKFHYFDISRSFEKINMIFVSSPGFSGSLIQIRPTPKCSFAYS